MEGQVEVPFIPRTFLKPVKALVNGAYSNAIWGPRAETKQTFGQTIF